MSKELSSLDISGTYDLNIISWLTDFQVSIFLELMTY